MTGKIHLIPLADSQPVERSSKSGSFGNATGAEIIISLAPATKRGESGGEGILIKSAKPER
jgi:hypothetical protein